MNLRTTSSSAFRINTQTQSQTSALTRNVEGAKGNTVLHRAIMQNNFSDIVTILEFMNTKAVSQMARTVNDNGSLPIHLLVNSTLRENHKQYVYDKLINFMCDSELKPLLQPIDLAEIRHCYPCEDNVVLANNLAFACDVANNTRTLIDASSSHPDHNVILKNNEIALETRLKLENDIQKMREILFKDMDDIEEDLENTLDELTTTIRYIHLYRQGNCEEYSFLGLHEALKLNPKIHSEVFYIKNGDHVILVLGEGNDAVCCDIFAGEIFPLSLLNDKLHTYVRYHLEDGSFLNVIANYNPNHHKLQSYFAISEAERQIYAEKYAYTRGQASSYIEPLFRNITEKPASDLTTGAQVVDTGTPFETSTLKEAKKKIKTDVSPVSVAEVSIFSSTARPGKRRHAEAVSTDNITAECTHVGSLRGSNN